MLKIREDWLKKHAAAYPQWAAVIEILIKENCFVVVPANKGWKDGGVKSQNLLVLEPGVKGPPAAYRINGSMIECVNYPGSNHPLSVIDWLTEVKKLTVSVGENEWIGGILSQ